MYISKLSKEVNGKIGQAWEESSRGLLCGINPSAFALGAAAVMLGPELLKMVTDDQLKKAGLEKGQWFRISNGFFPVLDEKYYNQDFKSITVHGWNLLRKKVVEGYFILGHHSVFYDTHSCIVQHTISHWRYIPEGPTDINEALNDRK